MRKTEIRPHRNYRRIDTGHVFTGRQLLNLLHIAEPAIQWVLLYSIEETDQLPDHLDTEYGLPENPGLLQCIVLAVRRWLFGE